MQIQYNIKGIIVCDANDPELITEILTTIREYGEAEVVEALEIKEEPK